MSQKESPEDARPALRDREVIAYDARRRWLGVPTPCRGCRSPTDLMVDERDRLRAGNIRRPGKKGMRAAGKQLKPRPSDWQTLAHPLRRQRFCTPIYGPGAARKWRPTANCRAQQQGDARVGQVRDRLLKDACRRAACVGRFRQQPRLSRRRDPAPPTTAPRSMSNPGKTGYISDAGRQAAEGRQFHTPLPKGRRPVSWHVPFADMVMAYGKQQKAAKTSCAVPQRKIYDQCSSPSRPSRSPTKMGKTTSCGRDDPSMLPFRHRGGERPFAAMPRPTATRRGHLKNTSSQTCTQGVQAMVPEEP